MADKEIVEKIIKYATEIKECMKALDVYSVETNRSEIRIQGNRKLDGYSYYFSIFSGSSAFFKASANGAELISTIDISELSTDEIIKLAQPQND